MDQMLHWEEITKSDMDKNKKAVQAGVLSQLKFRHPHKTQ